MHECDIDCWDLFKVQDFGLWGYSMRCTLPGTQCGADESNSLIGAAYSEEEDSHTLGDLMIAARNHCKEHHQ